MLCPFIIDREDKVCPTTDSCASPLMPQDQFLRVILELPIYCNLVEKSSLIFSPRNKLHNRNYEESKPEQNQNHIMPLCKAAMLSWFECCMCF